MSASQPIVLFDLFGVIALHQRPGALAQMAACCNAPADFFFVDDREDNVRAAQASGMTGHVFTGLGDLVKVVNPWLATRPKSPAAGVAAAYLADLS
jgi:FMN phosphatase YigB (HAD superfamily)